MAGGEKEVGPDEGAGTTTHPVRVHFHDDARGDSHALTDRVTDEGQTAGGVPPGETGMAFEPRFVGRFRIRTAMQKHVRVTEAAVSFARRMSRWDPRLSAPVVDQPGATRTTGDANGDGGQCGVDGACPQISAGTRGEHIGTVAKVHGEPGRALEDHLIEMEDDEMRPAIRAGAWRQVQGGGLVERATVAYASTEVVTQGELRLLSAVLYADPTAESTRDRGGYTRSWIFCRPRGWVSRSRRPLDALLHAQKALL